MRCITVSVDLQERVCVALHAGMLPSAEDGGGGAEGRGAAAGGARA